MYGRKTERGAGREARGVIFESVLNLILINKIRKKKILNHEIINKRRSTKT